MPLLRRIRIHLKGIYTTGDGYFINERGETVYGRLPRTKVENPLKTVRRLSLKSWGLSLI